MMADPVTRLERLLREERDALLMGKLEALSELADRKDRLAEALAHTGARFPPERLRALDGAAEENARLLEAARTGLTAAHERIAAIRAGAPLETYDAAGIRQRHAGQVRPGRRA